MPGGTHTPIFEYLRGFIIYIGASVVPQNLSERTLTPFLIAGIGLIVFACIIVYISIKNKLLPKIYAPLLFVLYSVINGVIIAYGRVGYYGAGTMASSRYTVESIMGLIGLIWISVICYPSIQKLNTRKAILWLGTLTIIISTVFCYRTETEIAIYRAAYQDQMKEQMLNINEATDDALNIFQESPEHVRNMVDFFRTNQLSIFSGE